MSEPEHLEQLADERMRSGCDRRRGRATAARGSFHCAQDGEPAASAPDAECLGWAIYHLEHESPLEQGGTATDFSGHDMLVQATVADFRANLSLPAGASVTVDYRFFAREYEENGLAIELSADGHTWRYLAANVWGETPYALTRDDGAGNVWICGAL